MLEFSENRVSQPSSSFALRTPIFENRILYLTNRHLRKLCSALLIAGGLGTTADVVSAQVSFQQAVADYNGGKYGRALTEFLTYESANPNNALVHYYVALCLQSTGQFEQAKTEFSWVATHADGQLRSMGAAGLAQLAHAHLQGTASSHQVAMGVPGARGSDSQTSAPAPKVKKVIEFYADW